MKRARTGRWLALALIALLLPALGYTASTAWRILKQSDSEQATFEALSRQVAQDAEAAAAEPTDAAAMRPADASGTEPTGDVPGSTPRGEAGAKPGPDGAQPTRDANKPGAQAQDSGEDAFPDNGLTLDAAARGIVLGQYRGLVGQNPDFFGWIRIDDTRIDYPVMFTPRDPEYYLHRDFYGAYSYSGTPFVEGHCAENGRYYIVYAHHMTDGSMFGGLPKYEKKEYWEDHPVIRFDTRYESREYRVLAAFRSRVYGEKDKGVFRYYEYTNLDDPSRFEAYMAGVRSEALYDTGVEAAYGDELLALSTCNYHTRNGRFVVVAKRVK